MINFALWPCYLMPCLNMVKCQLVLDLVTFFPLSRTNHDNNNNRLRPNSKLPVIAKIFECQVESF